VLRVEATRTRRGHRHAVVAVLISALAASCSTSGSDVPFGFDTVGPADITPQTSDFAQATTNSASGYVVDEDDPVLPDAVAVAPQIRPGSETEVAAVAAPSEAASPVVEQATAEQTATDVPLPSDEQVAAVAETVEEQGSTDDEPAPATQFIENAPQTTQVAAIEPKKRGFLSSFFSTQARAASAPQSARPLVNTERAQPQVAAATPITQLTSAEPAEPQPLIQQPSAGGGDALPGVRQNSLFEIKRRSGLDDDSDIDLHEGGELYQVASAAGMARLAPNGLLQQTEHVDVACLKPSLVRVLKTLERHYGKKVVVTSGYRSPDRNRQARGATNSLHMYCAAADVQVEGVSKWDLAAYVRSMPGRGGVGTYCHTNSVHVDVGPERDWNWRCRRRG
jgi:uncharacterized protein YcbK (DUF882 family)